ncbi:hypothetical protein J4Q44_G00179420 [Coregonus suidteri]|uniref:LITAF domain-containing protein n=1 Tax=Coregonus suidteri TaxID=861788 RepID=A0AAN8LJW6_9TELE
MCPHCQQTVVTKTETNPGLLTWLICGGLFIVGYTSGPSGPVPVVTHVIMTPSLKEVGGLTMCPHCQQTVVTKTETNPGLLTWLICGGLFIVGCWLCCVIPFCVESCKDVEHSCPTCNKIIYVYKRI